MPTTVTPPTLLVRQLDEFVTLLPALRDGSSDAIHTGRIATRRMRAVLPLLAGRLTPNDLEHFRRALKRLTRRLGRARDLDVQLELLDELEPAAPNTGEDVQSLRAEWRREREKCVRRLVKTMERLRVESVLDALRRAASGDRVPMFAIRRHVSAAPLWENAVTAQVRELAGTVAEAVDRAGGAMFPKRLHGARVSIKKLRYAMEVATATGAAKLEDAVASMRKAQQILGRLHDLDMLGEALRDTRHGEERIMPVVEYRRQSLHARYLRRRADVLTACRVAALAASRAHRARTMRRTALIASVPLAVLALPLARRAS